MNAPVSSALADTSTATAATDDARTTLTNWLETNPVLDVLDAGDIRLAQASLNLAIRHLNEAVEALRRVEARAVTHA